MTKNCNHRPQHDPERYKALSAQMHDHINKRLALDNELAKH